MGDALRSALRDFYHQSWRLLVLNASLSLAVLTILVAALYAPTALVLLALVGPLAAALMHCAVTLAQTEDLRLGEAVTGIRLHWRVGAVLGTVNMGAVLVAFVAFRFYAGAGAWAWPLAVLVVYLLALFVLLQIALWPLAVYERGRPFTAVVRDAALAVLRRPLGFAGLALALLVLNAVGAAAALLPLLTLTVAYSFLAAAHYALPRSPLREVGS
jgi:hypothetical protein